ncbi:MAG: hypothetical protein U0359_09010 [Byssovorax sp.]
MPAFSSPEVTLLRRNWLVLALAVSPLLLGPAALVWGAQNIGDVTRAVALTVGFIAPLVGLITTLYALRASPLKVQRRGPLTAGEGGLTFRGERLATLADLQAGFLIPTWGKPPQVRLLRRWPRAPIELWMRDDAEGRALLEALGLDASQRVASFTLASRARADNRVTAVGWTLLVLILVGSPMLASALAEPGPALALIGLFGLGMLFLWISLMSMPTRVTVGSDGVLVSWLFRKRFLPYASIRGVRPYGSGREQGVGIWSDDAKVVKLPIKIQLTQELNDQQTELLSQRIQQAIQRYAERRHEGRARLPERGDRRAVEWVRMLRAAGSGAAADHRTAPIEADVLWRVVEDPGASPIDRASAAVAASGLADEAGRARLRIAARATASPDVQRALALAAEEEAGDEELARALDRLRAR